MVFIDFSGFVPPKNDEKTMLKRIRKKSSDKNLSKINFDLHFGLQKPPKSRKKLEKSAPRAM